MCSLHGDIHSNADVLLVEMESEQARQTLIGLFICEQARPEVMNSTCLQVMHFIS